MAKLLSRIGDIDKQNELIKKAYRSSIHYQDLLKERKKEIQDLKNQMMMYKLVFQEHGINPEQKYQELISNPHKALPRRKF